jgi:hypothetical protein
MHNKDNAEPLIAHSEKPAYCPECGGKKLAFVVDLEGGAKCLSCHIALSAPAAKPDYKKISLEVSVLAQPREKARESGVSVSLEAQARANSALRRRRP